MEVPARFYMNFPWNTTLAMVFHRICTAVMVFPWGIVCMALPITELA